MPRMFGSPNADLRGDQQWVLVRSLVQARIPPPARYVLLVAEPCLSDVMATYVSMGRSMIAVRGQGDLRYFSRLTLMCLPPLLANLLPSDAWTCLS